MTSRTFRSRRESQPSQTTARTTKSKGGVKTTTTTTTTRYFVDGKETRRDTSQSKTSAVTPRVSRTNQLQQSSFKKVRDISPQDTRQMAQTSRGRTNTAHSRNSRLYQPTVSASNKSVRREDKNYESRSNV